MIVPLILRLLPARHFITPERTYYYGPDSYDHMRRALLMLNDFPGIPQYNFYQGYPVGTTLFLSPLYDFAIALAAKIVGLGDPSMKAVEMVGVFLPVLVAMSAVLMVYILARQVMGKGAAFFSAFVFGILPGYLYYSTAGQPDNNVVEPLVACLYFYLLLRSLKAEKRGITYALLAALAGVLSILVWRGATIFWVIAFGTIAVNYIAGLKDTGNKGLSIRAGGVIFMVKGLILFLLTWQGLLAVRNVVSFREVSYFHAILCIVTGLGLLSAYGGTVLVRLNSGIKVLACATLLFMIPVALVFVLVPSFAHEVLGAWGMMGRGDVWLMDNIEYKSSVFPGGEFSFIRPSTSLSLLFWCVPPGLLWFMRRLFSTGGERAGMSFLIVCTAVFFLSALSHVRFENLLSINVAVLGGLVLERFVLKAGENRKRLVASILLACMLLPAALGAVAFSSGRLRVLEIQKEFMGTMDWLRENTPETSYFMEPTRRPEYGVMAEWSIGSWVENIARRPTVATNFGGEIYGIEESAKFFLSEDEEESIRILEKNKVRYVIVTNLIPSLGNYALIAGRPPAMYAALKEGRWVPGVKYFNLVSTSLLLADGVGSEIMGMPLKQLDHFRLLYESEEEMKARGLPRPVKKIKVFEYVPGAVLEVAARPGEEVSVHSRVGTNQGLEFEFLKTRTAGPDGRAGFVLQYAEADGPGRTGLMEPYTVRAAGGTARLSVADADVLAGRRFTLNLK
jgi:dolichyl-diphosphooligosaccharide--protein glycosyltransferase